MLNLSKSCHYALRALLCLAKNKDRPYVKINEIATKEKIPSNFLSKIFQILVKNGFADSLVGPQGGVRLSSNSGRLTVADAISTIDGKKDLRVCTLFGYGKCPELDNCPIQNECKNYSVKIWDKLKKMRLNKL